jgi:hypothetical protein
MPRSDAGGRKGAKKGRYTPEQQRAAGEPKRRASKAHSPAIGYVVFVWMARAGLYRPTNQGVGVGLPCLPSSFPGSCF